MSHADESLRRDYHHPYKPYDIQTQFMDALYDCIEDGKVGIFESPTGERHTRHANCQDYTDVDLRNRMYRIDPVCELQDADQGLIIPGQVFELDLWLVDMAA